MIARLWLLGAAALWLGGCSLLPSVPAADPAEQRSRLLALADWEARGRIAVKAGERGAQGNLQWVQASGEARLRLSGPFGAGAWDIHWDPQRLTVRNRDGEVAAAYAGPDAAEQFLAQQLGWSFPVVSTRYWILGLPDPAAPATAETDATGRVTRIQQHGWDVTYEDFIQQAGLWLPRKFAMESPRGRLRVVVDRWRF